jgi:hypothetical protein
MTHWSIGGNPAVRPTFTHDPKSPAPGVPVMCRATEPIRSMYVEAFRHHIRENGVRLLKFDNLHAVCNNPGHEHLPGLYSTEPIQDAVIEFLHALDRECPDVFLMLYWGHRSPWWLLHADTLFDSGIGIEAASPSALPAPHVRDSVTQRLDQAQWHASDVPALGKDSLGVWLSDWGWNSSVGKERWPEGFVMDLCRGSLLAQPWSDYPWLSPPERKQMGELIALLKAQPQCFANPRFILGDPWKDEPYGYCCTDGKRAFLAIHNSAWKDSVLKLQLGPEWGLPEGRSWRIFRWHPDPARLVGPGESFGAETALAVRPFEVVLLEVVPSGQAASLDRPMPSKPIPTAFAEPSRAVEVAVEDRLAQPPAEEDAVWTVLEPAAFKAASGASLAKQKDGSLLAGGKVAQQDAYTITASTDLSRITAVRLEVLPDASLPCNGPGRAINGNLALTEFRLAAAPKGKPGSSKPVAFARAVADWSQESYGGWPIAAAIDGDPKTGWSLDPQEGLRHAAVFEANEPVGGPEGSVLTFTLEQDFREHSLGRFRLAVTTARPPLPAPKGYGPWQLVVRGQSPATAAGGLLVVTAEMKQAGAPLWLPNVGSHFQHDGKWAGRVAPWKAVLGKATYPAPWQAWRLPVEPGSAAQSFELSVSSRVSPGVQMRWSGRFVPK